MLRNTIVRLTAPAKSIVVRTIPVLLAPVLPGCLGDSLGERPFAGEDFPTEDDYPTDQGTPTERATSTRAADDADSRRVRTGAFADATLYVNPYSNAADQADEWSYSDLEGATLMDAIAAQPTALWLGEWSGDVEDTVDDALDDAAGQLLTFVIYNIPNRDCGAWSSGGVEDAAEYADFIAGVARGLTGRPALLVLEPDALPLTDCLSSTQEAERFAMMAAAVTTLTATGSSPAETSRQAWRTPSRHAWLASCSKRSGVGMPIGWGTRTWASTRPSSSTAKPLTEVVPMSRPTVTFPSPMSPSVAHTEPSRRRGDQ